MGHLVHFLVGSGGACALEALGLYERFGRLNQKRFNRLRKSATFWCIFAGMVFASGFVACALFYEHAEAPMVHVMLAGMGARSTVRSMLAAGVANRQPTGGVSTDTEDTFHDAVL